MRMVRRSQKFEEMVRQLTETPHSTVGRPIFPTIRELMCFAAVLGYEHNRRKSLQPKYLEIDSRPFERSETTTDLIYLLALASARDVDVLRDDESDQLVSIFEEYAEGGFEILEGWLREKPEDTNGDRAILSALAKYGYLTTWGDTEISIGDISFA